VAGNGGCAVLAAVFRRGNGGFVVPATAVLPWQRQLRRGSGGSVVLAAALLLLRL
jgi:hypothetical protein